MTTLLIPTLRRYDLLREAVRSAAEGTHQPTRYHIIDNGGRIPDEVAYDILLIAQQTGAKLHLDRMPYNLGVAASWNRGFAMLPASEPWIIIANDDVTFARSTIAKLIDAARADEQGVFFFPGANGYKNAWSLFLEKRKAWETIGWYDEHFMPAYHEDNDRSRRLHLAGYRHIPVPGCGYGHVDSATIKAFSKPEMDVHWQRFGQTRAYYVEKWGGEPGQETYTVPFDGTRPDHRNSGYERDGF